MKRGLFLHIILMLALLVSCNETYPGLDYDMSGNDIIDDEHMIDSVIVDKDRIPLTLSIIDPSYTTLSRNAAPAGSGAFDKERPDTMRIPQWETADFHILGIRHAEDADYTVTRDQDSTMCMVDNAVARVTDLNSLMLTFNSKEGDEPTNYYYSHDHMLNKFNFYAYYIDNLEKPALQRDRDSIWFNFQIDGSQDILTGSAKLTERQQAHINAHEEKDSLQKYYYSTYTATRDIFPVVDLDHHLVRFKFFIYPGDETANNMAIQSIRIRACHKGKLVVAHRDASRLGAIWEPEKAWLSLRDEGDEPALSQDKYHVPFQEGDEKKQLYERTGMQVGESLLVPPAHSFIVEVTTVEWKSDDTTVPYVTEYVIENKELFKPNYEYRIRIGLYGPDELTMDAILTGWSAGGEIHQDMEDVFDF